VHPDVVRKALEPVLGRPTTERGIGLGSTRAEVRRTFGCAFSLHPDRTEASARGLTFSLANGVLTGIQARSSFCCAEVRRDTDARTWNRADCPDAA